MCLRASFTSGKSFHETTPNLARSLRYPTFFLFHRARFGGRCEEREREGERDTSVFKRAARAFPRLPETFIFSAARVSEESGEVGYACVGARVATCLCMYVFMNVFMRVYGISYWFGSRDDCER